MCDQGEGFPGAHGFKGRSSSVLSSYHQTDLCASSHQPKAAPAASSSTAAASIAPPATPAPAPVAAETPPAAPAAAPQPPNAPILTPAQAVAPEAAPAEQRPLGSDTSFLTGEALQSTIQNMIEMGFEREQVMRALRASFSNPERAVEYLFNVCVPRICLLSTR